MLDYKVFQHCGVLVSLIKTYFILIFSKWDRASVFDNVFPNCVFGPRNPKIFL